MYRSLLVSLLATVGLFNLGAVSGNEKTDSDRLGESIEYRLTGYELPRGLTFYTYSTMAEVRDDEKTSIGIVYAALNMALEVDEEGGWGLISESDAAHVSEEIASKVFKTVMKEHNQLKRALYRKRMSILCPPSGNSPRGNEAYRMMELLHDTEDTLKQRAFVKAMRKIKSIDSFAASQFLRELDRISKGIKITRRNYEKLYEAVGKDVDYHVASVCSSDDLGE